MGRVISFPVRKSGPVSAVEASGFAKRYLEASPTDRASLQETLISEPETLSSLLALLASLGNSSPATVAAEAALIYAITHANRERIGFLDEGYFFVGESALLAGSAARLLGQRLEAERWLDRSESNFRHTVNPAPSLARVSYVRLALRYDMRLHEDVLELLPSVLLTFEKQGMVAEAAKCRFLEAMSLKDLGRVEEAALGFESLASASGQADEGLRGAALVNLGDLRSSQGRFDVALKAYSQATPLLRASNRAVVLADLKAMIGETLRSLGRPDQALTAYREAVRGYLELGIATRTAYIRLVIAETLLGEGRAAEAEWEIAAALPTIEDQEMLPEGRAAVALLRESLRVRKTDVGALFRLREVLKSSN